MSHVVEPACSSTPPPWGADTVWCVNDWGDKARLQKPAVACSDDRIVWVYSQLNTDTIFEAYALVTNWYMGVGVAEPPVTPVTPVTHQLEITNPIGSEITLRYSNCPQGFRASVFDASGSKVDQIQSSATSGTILWGGGGGGHGCYGVCYGCYGPGVYFIVPQDKRGSAKKVILLR